MRKRLYEILELADDSIQNTIKENQYGLKPIQQYFQVYRHSF